MHAWLLRSMSGEVHWLAVISKVVKKETFSHLWGTKCKPTPSLWSTGLSRLQSLGKTCNCEETRLFTKDHNVAPQVNASSFRWRVFLTPWWSEINWRRGRDEKVDLLWGARFAKNRGELKLLRDCKENTSWQWRGSIWWSPFVVPLHWASWRDWALNLRGNQSKIGEKF